MKLSGTAAIISGGASGLGEAAARALAAAGATVLVADRNEERGKAVAAATGGEFVKTDVADEASVAAAVAAAAGHGVPLRVVVNCAGIGWAERTVNRDGSPHSLASYRKVIEINLIGTFNLMRIAAAARARAAASPSPLAPPEMIAAVPLSSMAGAYWPALPAWWPGQASTTRAIVGGHLYYRR